MSSLFEERAQGLVFAVLRSASIAGALLLALLVPAPASARVSICVLCACVWVPDLVPKNWRVHTEWWVGGFMCLVSVLLVIMAWVASAAFSFWDNMYAVIAWLLAGAVGTTKTRVNNGRARPLWKGLTVLWIALGEYIWLGGAYLQNRQVEFYIGLVVGIALLVLCRVWFRLHSLAILGLNTGILLLIVVPLADLVVRPSPLPDPNPDVAGRDYLYSEYRKDPVSYARYAQKFVAQWHRFQHEVYLRDPSDPLPYRLRPNSEAPFFQSRILINSQGFRGGELIRPKGRAYRILALGESTTFGLTLTPDHKPWPEALADLIQTELQPERPVEVVNAGVPGYTLEYNLYRLKELIPTLQPDMIISYHGYNGFVYLYPDMPSIFARNFPARSARPLWLLAECEYRVKLHAFRRSLVTKSLPELPLLPVIMRSQYARAYEELVELAATNGISLVIGNFSMAVNASSPSEVKEFYRNTGFPNVYPAIQVNEIHTLLVDEIGLRHPEVCVVDTHPRLDGAHEKFTDLVHFDPAGDGQLAATFLGGIRGLLREELAGGSASKPSAPPVPQSRD